MCATVGHREQKHKLMEVCQISNDNLKKKERQESSVVHLSVFETFIYVVCVQGNKSFMILLWKHSEVLVPGVCIGQCLQDDMYHNTGATI